MDWQPIETAPVGVTVILGSVKAKWAGVGWGRWQDDIPRPLWSTVDDMGFGRCTPTHWMPLPTPPEAN